MKVLRWVYIIVYGTKIDIKPFSITVNHFEFIGKAPVK